MNFELKVLKLQEMIDEATNIVCLTGAGVSTASGIKDFRSDDGLYKMLSSVYKDPTYMLSHTCFEKEPESFYEFYKKYMNCLDKSPNIVHEYLTKLEKKGKLKGIITQNIDGLHEKAHSKNVYEIHGSIYRNYCVKCHKFYSASYVFGSKGIPLCSCSGIVKPDVILYGESLNNSFNEAIKLVVNADLFLVIGTSLTVFPASSLVDYFHGKNLVIINYDKTNYDFDANLVINDDLVKVFKKLK